MKAPLVAAAVLASLLATSARGAAAEPDAEAAATALVAEAARAYDQSQLDEALRLLARAYELSPRPSILYNQAQVLRTKDDCAAALDAYQRFIAATTAADPNRERAVHRRAEMQACVDARARATGASPAHAADGVAMPAEEAPPAESAAAPTTAPGPKLTLADRAAPETAPPAVVIAPSAATPADDHASNRARTMRVTGWALVGVGVLAAATSAALAWRAHSIQEELTGVSSWSNDRQARYDEGNRDATLARWFGAGAALAAGGGAALLIVYRPAAAPVDAGGASHATALFGWSGTF